MLCCRSPLSKVDAPVGARPRAPKFGSQDPAAQHFPRGWFGGRLDSDGRHDVFAPLSR